MKRTFTMIILSIVSGHAFGQLSFEEILSQTLAPPVLEGVGTNSSAAFADVDGDNDLDILIAGQLPNYQGSTKLYLNDGIGNYTEALGTPFVAVYDGSIAFADVDGVNGPDVLITGRAASNARVAKLYTNDGTGSFTEVVGTPFDGVQYSSIAFEDVDGINGPDVLITGSIGTSAIAKLYLNDGSGSFTESIGTPFEGVNLGSIAFADIDGVNGPDVLITGVPVGTWTPTSKLYTNDGSGSFTEVVGTPFDSVYRSSISFADVDGINGPDVLITGENTSGDEIAKLYTNDGSGNFAEVAGTPFEGVSRSYIAFADVDGINGPDVLITGENSSHNEVAKLYTNDGSGNFAASTGNPFQGVSQGCVAFGDIDGVNGLDVLITGNIPYPDGTAKLYTNDGTGSYTELTGKPLAGASDGSIAFADVDGINGPDVLITGLNSANVPSSRLYINDGDGNYSLALGNSFTGVAYGSSVAFADVDGINGPDVLLTGFTIATNGFYERVAKLYTNDGSGNYSEVSGTPFPGIEQGSIAFADVDGINGPDLLIAGRVGSNQYATKLYINDGTGNFTEVIGTPFALVQNSSVAFADVDGINGPDLLITGSYGFTALAKLYLNDGSGSFTEVAGTPFVGVGKGSVAFADVDGVNGQDVLIAGESATTQRIAKLYINDGSGNFTEVTGTSFDGVKDGSVAFADVDGVLGPDLLITGTNVFNEYISKLYINDGSGGFVEATGMPFPGVTNSSIAFQDIDNDNDQDVLITGLTEDDEPVAIPYRNLTLQSEQETDVISACGNYIWRDGITYTESTIGETYFVSGVATTGADSVYVLNLTVNSVSDVSTNLVDGTITSNNQSATAYQWLDCDNAHTEISLETGQEFTPTANGNYAVEITENGCVDTSDCVTFLTVAIVENVLQELSVFPNPAESVISWNGVTAQTAEIYDNIGRSVLTITQPNGKADISKLTSGIYILRLFSEEGTYTSRILKR